MSLSRYLTLVPGGDQAQLVHTLVRWYVTDYLDYEVELRLQTADLPQARLGDKTARLGANIWLGRPQDEVIDQVVSYS